MLFHSSSLPTDNVEVPKQERKELEEGNDDNQKFHTLLGVVSVLVGPCHHGMARPQVADRGTVSDKEGSCE